MPDPTPTEPPPSQLALLLSAAVGGFGGAVLGVIAATTMMGDGDNGDEQAAIESAPVAEIVVADN